MRFFTVNCLVLMLAIPLPAQAQQSEHSPRQDPAGITDSGQNRPSPVPQESATEEAQKLQQLQHSNQVMQQVIRNLIKRIEQLEQAASPAVTESNDSTGADTQPASPKIKQKLEQQSSSPEDLINRAFEQRLNKQGGMLLGSNQFVYEPGLTLAHSSYDTVVVDGYTVYPVLVVGDIVSEKVERSIITNNHALRFGLPGDLQLDLVIPLGYEKQRLFRENGTSDRHRTEGIGDISIALNYQWIRSSPDWPDTVLAFNWKTKTGGDPYRLEDSEDLTLGSGFHSYGLSLTSMASNDPVVMFGGLTATYTEDDMKRVGRVKPGIGFGINLGMALALNFDTSLSFSLQVVDTNKTRIDGARINGSDSTTGSFAVGFSTSRGNGHAVDIDLAIGLTADSPDFQLSFSFPFNFSY